MLKRNLKINYRVLITNWFEQKQKANPRFSLGALARKLGYSSTSSLSNVLSGKRSLSSKHAKLLVEIMELPPGQARSFLEAVAAEKMSRKGFDIDIEVESSKEEVFDESPQLPAVTLAHFVACSKTGAGLCPVGLQGAIELISRELKTDGKKVFEDLLKHGVLIKDGDILRPAGKKPGVCFTMASEGDRKQILRSAQELQSLVAERYLEQPQRSNIHMAVVRVRADEVDSMRQDLISAIRDVYERYSYGDDLTTLVGFQTNFVKLD